MHGGGTPGQALALPHVGQLLGGKYKVERLLGEGGMAFVYEATHQRLHQRVAIKLLAPELVTDPELVARFAREARAVAKLRSKHITRVIDVDTTPEAIPFIVMEFLEGRDLDAELQERTKLPLDESVDYLLQACAGMHEAHSAGIVHRDLKPANLFLARDRGASGRVVKVLDFGISKMVGEAKKLTVAGAVMGTVLYMSPEQVLALPNVDTRADIWALGVILYELIAGHAPWEGTSHQIAGAIVSKEAPDLRKYSNVPEQVALVVQKMLKRDPAQRYATLRDVIAALGSFAPMGSVGAAIFDQVTSGRTSSQQRPAAAPASLLAKHTIPMLGSPYANASSRPGLVAPPAPSSSGTHGVPSVTTARLAAVSAPPEVAPRGHLFLVLAVVIGLLGAAGTVLIVLAVLHRRPASLPAPAGDAAPSAAHGGAPAPGHP